MKIYEWKEGMPLEESKEGAYWERNMMVLWIAKVMSATYERAVANGDGELCKGIQCGWYNDLDNNWDGWHRVISLMGGTISFHIPDDFDVGSLEEIEPNWNGHTTHEKWTSIMEQCGCDLRDIGGLVDVDKR